MTERGFLENRTFATAGEIVRGQGSLITVSKDDQVSEVVELLKKKAISQIPVVDGSEFVGSLTDSNLLKKVLEDPQIGNKKVEEVMGAPFPFVALGTTVDVMTSMMSHGAPALLVRDNGESRIITQADLLSAAV